MSSDQHSATSPLCDPPEEMPIAIGTRVRVKPATRQTRPTKYAGRVGVVQRANTIDARLLYVDLDATGRARARREAFWCNSLEIIGQTEAASN